MTKILSDIPYQFLLQCTIVAYLELERWCWQVKSWCLILEYNNFFPSVSGGNALILKLFLKKNISLFNAGSPRTHQQRTQPPVRPRPRLLRPPRPPPQQQQDGRRRRELQVPLVLLRRLLLGPHQRGSQEVLQVVILLRRLRRQQQARQLQRQRGGEEEGEVPHGKVRGTPGIWLFNCSIRISFWEIECCVFLNLDGADSEEAPGWDVDVRAPPGDIRGGEQKIFKFRQKNIFFSFTILWDSINYFELRFRLGFNSTFFLRPA